jgi:pyruvate/2-oxoglutarate dehydrogenase complex dihydrolipoamide dehydrogenase (E3) component
MSVLEKYDVIVFGGGTAGKVIAWTMSKQGERTAVIDRKYVGGSCPNIACLPSKNVIHAAKVASLLARHAEFGMNIGPASIDMARVYERKRAMVDGIAKVHLDRYQATGCELIWGEGTFIAPQTVHVALRDGSEHTLIADRLFVDVGTHATLPDTPGLRQPIL